MFNVGWRIVLPTSLPTSSDEGVPLSLATTNDPPWGDGVPPPPPPRNIAGLRQQGFLGSPNPGNGLPLPVHHAVARRHTAQMNPDHEVTGPLAHVIAVLGLLPGTARRLSRTPPSARLQPPVRINALSVIGSLMVWKRWAVTRRKRSFRLRPPLPFPAGLDVCRPKMKGLVMVCCYAKASTMRLGMTYADVARRSHECPTASGAATSFAAQQGSTLWRPLCPCETDASWVFTQRMSRHRVPSRLPNPCCTTPNSRYSNGTHGAIPSDALFKAGCL